MLDKLREIKSRFDEVNALLCRPEVASDVQRSAELMRELKTLTPLVETYDRYTAAVEDGEAARALLAEHPDKETRWAGPSRSTPASACRPCPR